MTISQDGNTIILTGSCGVEEVEPLVACLESREDLCVDISAATGIHTALWQALMVFKPKIAEVTVPSLATGKLLAGLRTYINKTLEG